MARFLAGAAACFLLLTGAFLLWQGRAEEPPVLPPAPPAMDTPSMVARIVPDDATLVAELFAPRRKSFAKLDKNGDGILSFDEWAVKTLDKFGGADKDRSGWLTPAEYATTAPPPPKRKKCAC